MTWSDPKVASISSRMAANFALWRESVSLGVGEARGCECPSPTWYVPRAGSSCLGLDTIVSRLFEQPDEPSVRAQLRWVADDLRPRFPAVAELLERAEDDLLAHFTFPPAHRRRIRSTNLPGAAQQGSAVAPRA